MVRQVTNCTKSLRIFPFSRPPIPSLSLFLIISFTLLPIISSSHFPIISEAWSATYYVDATNGNNSNNGLSMSSAWKTIAKINTSRFQSGDQILFKKGEVWREQLITPNSGTYANRITFGAYGAGNRPITTGLNLILPGSSWTLHSGNIWKATVTIQPKVVVFDSTLGINVASNVAVNAVYKWWWSANVLYVYSDSDPNTKYINPGIQVGARNNAINITKNYITIDNLELSGANITWMGNVHMESDGVHHFIMQNCESKWGAGHGFTIGPGNGGSNVVKDSLFHDNVGCGISSDTDTGPTNTTQNYFQRNKVYNNRKEGIAVNANYWIVENNEVYDNGVGTIEYIGIHIYTATALTGSGLNNIIRYNKVYNQKGSGQDGAGIAADQWCDNNQIYYNICYNNDGPGFYNYDAKGNRFYNNIAYGNCQNSSGGLALKGEFRLTGTRTGNTELKNNIGYSTVANTYAIYVSSDDAYDTTLDITNNLWYSVAPNWYFWNLSGGNNLSTWNGFKKHTGAKDLNSDPKFVSPVTDFWLQPTSPCINAGTNVGLIQDYKCNSIQGPVDIGAYEYTGLKITE